MSNQRLPRVAIVGRPNVGKSSLFNRFVERREALVHNQPGVTRDRIYGDVEWMQRRFEVIDTGGLEPGNAEPLKHLVERQVQFAIEEARLIIMVVDGKQGAVPLDRHIANKLRRHGKIVLLAVNKVDEVKQSGIVGDFFELGLGQPYWCSAMHGTNVDELLTEVVHGLVSLPEETPEPAYKGIKIAFIGKPNAGKSTMVNRLVGQERLLVHSAPGTTRDSIMVPFVFEGRDYTLVDTAGVRRGAKVKTAVEKLSVIATNKAIEKADLVVVVLDAERGLDAQDKRVAGLVDSGRKPCVVAINKWDTVPGVERKARHKEWEAQMAEEMRFLNFCPTIFMSGQKGQKLDELMAAVDRVNANRTLFYPAKQLTSIVKEASILHQPPVRNGRKLQVYYATQLRNRLATFIFKVNDTDLVHFSYQRFLENTFRKVLGFEGIPLTLEFGNRSRNVPNPAAGARMTSSPAPDSNDDEAAAAAEA